MFTSAKNSNEFLRGHEAAQPVQRHNLSPPQVALLRPAKVQIPIRDRGATFLEWQYILLGRPGDLDDPFVPVGTPDWRPSDRLCLTAGKKKSCGICMSAVFTRFGPYYRSVAEIQPLRRH